MEEKTRILLVDDDKGLLDSLQSFLQRSGFQVATAINGEAALDEVTSFTPHLILLDILMPVLDGRTALRRLRQTGNWTPVIMLTAVDTTAEKTMALNDGADDYVLKSCEPGEIVARIGAVLRRVRSNQAPLASAMHLRSGELRLDRRSRTAWLRGKPLSLSPKAVTVLEYLMLHLDHVVSREEILDKVWDIDSAIGTRAVDARVAELRRALEDEHLTPTFIDTVPGQGYRFVGSVEVAP